MSRSERNMESSAHVPADVLLAFGMGGLIPIALFNIAGQLMALLGNISLGLGAVALGGIMMIPRFWDAFSDPLVGHWSDNARTRWGRRRPFVLVGALAVAVSFVLMWWVPKGFGPVGQLIYILGWMMIFYTACTVFEIPHGALGMEKYKDPHARTKLFSAKSFCGNLFALGTPWLMALANLEIFRGAGGNEIDGMRFVSMAIALVLVPMAIWWFITLKEPEAEAVSHERVPFWKHAGETLSNRGFLLLTAIFFILAMGFNFVGLLNYYISIFYLYGGDKVAAGTLLGVNGTVWAITALLAVFPLNALGPRLGKRKTLALAIVLMCLAQLAKIACYNPELPYLVIIPTVLLSAGMLMFFTLGPSMLGDLCDEVELKTGHRSDGSFYSVYWWFIKMGTTLASFVTGLLIVVSRFDEKQPSLLDSLLGPARELAVAGLGVEAGVNFNAITWAVVFLLGGAVALVFAARKRSWGLGALGAALALAACGLGGYQFVKKDAEPPKTNVAEKLDAVTTAVAEVDAYFAERALVANPEHYAELRGLLAEISTTAENQAAALEDPAFDLAKLRAEAEEMVALALRATRQSESALFRLRAIEIALPLLLSAVSLLLTFKYPLNEKRVYEIKAELERRRENLSHE